MNAKVPLLEHGDNLVVESDLVTKYVAQHVGEEGMYPYDARDEMDSFLEETWYPVVDRYYDYLCASSRKGADAARKKFCVSLRMLNDELFIGRDDSSFEHFKNGDFFLGEQFSVVECIAGPWLQRFLVTLPYFRGVDFMTEILPEECTRLEKWVRAVTARQSVMESACSDDEILAAARKYYVSYLSPGAPGVL